MTGFTDYWARKIVEHTTGLNSLDPSPPVYVAVYTTVGDDAGGFIEPSSGSYARAATVGAWNSASGSAPSSISNAIPIQFSPATEPWGQLIGFGLHDALSGGNRLCWDYLGPYAWQVAFAQAGTPVALHAPAHGLSIGDLIVVSTEYAGVVPTFSLSDFAGILSVNSVSPDAFTVTNAGIYVNAAVSGSGLFRRVAPQTIDAAVSTLTFDTGQLTISA